MLIYKKKYSLKLSTNFRFRGIFNKARAFQEKTHLNSHYTIKNELTTIETKIPYTVVKFMTIDNVFVTGTPKRFQNYCKSENYMPAEFILSKGTIEPDEWYIQQETKQIFIIEKKSQFSSGSTDEKLQTGVFKRRVLSNALPQFTVHYVYC